MRYERGKFPQITTAFSSNLSFVLNGEYVNICTYNLAQEMRPSDAQGAIHENPLYG
jgi:hypothetical protein